MFCCPLSHSRTQLSLHFEILHNSNVSMMPSQMRVHTFKVSRVFRESPNLSNHLPVSRFQCFLPAGTGQLFFFRLHVYDQGVSPAISRSLFKAITFHLINGQILIFIHYGAQSFNLLKHQKLIMRVLFKIQDNLFLVRPTTCMMLFCNGFLYKLQMLVYYRWLVYYFVFRKNIGILNFALLLEACFSA